MRIILHLFAFTLISGISFSLFAQNPVIDSLENYAEKADPGWDRIDVSIALAELYVYERLFDKAEKTVHLIHQIADQQNLVEAHAYALVLEGIIADESMDNAEKAVEHYQEAIQLARSVSNKDALAFATTELSKIYIWNKGNTEKGMGLLHSLYSELNETVSLKNQGTLQKCLGRAYTLEGKYDSARVAYDRAMGFYQKSVSQPSSDPRIDRVSAQTALSLKQLSATQNDLGNLYLKQGDMNSALSYKRQALLNIQKTHIEKDLAWMYVNLGKVYTSLGDYGRALDFIGKARRIYEADDLKSDIAWIDGVTTQVFIKLKDYPTAEEYCKRNLDYLEEANPNSHYFGGTLLGMVIIQFGKKDLSKASEYLTRAKQVIAQSDNSANRSILIRLQGELALKEGDYEKAEVIYHQAIGLNKSLGAETELAQCQYKLGETFYNQHEYDSALYYTNSAQLALSDSKSTELVKECYLLKSKIFQALNDYEKAFHNHQAFSLYSDSLYTTAALEKLKNEQVRQNVLDFKEDKELAEQNAALLHRQNQIYVIVGVAIIIILLMVIYLYLNLRKVKVKIQSQNDELIQLNQTKDKFFGIIAHDLRSPLIGLQGVGDQVDYFLRKGKIDRLERLSKNISSTTKRLNELLDNLLNWALLQNGMIPYHPEKVDIQEVVNTVIGLLAPVADIKNIDLQNKIASKSFAYADSKSVQTILRNIVSNALKFTEDGGSVSVDVKSENDRFIIIINDTGTGISAEQLPRLFELDKKSKDGTKGEKGSGLGLILCKELVELNKGSIEVVSDHGNGSSFIVDLPKHSEAA